MWNRILKTKKPKGIGGRIFILVGPSGSGKSTIVQYLKRKNKKIFYSVSMTTRAKRPGEREGRHYFFVSKDTFQKTIKKGELLEYANVYDAFYGTPKKPVLKALRAQRDVIMDLDSQGARHIKKILPKITTVILVLPPSFATLKRRLQNRKKEEVENRLKIDYRMIKNLAKSNIFDYWLINEKIGKTMNLLNCIITAEKLRWRSDGR